MSTSFDLNSLIRKNILELKPYRSARDDFDRGVLLDANENSLGAPFEDSRELHRYPMPYQEELRKKIADYRGVAAGNIFTGVGSDEAIDLLFRIFCVPAKDRVIINPPTYGMYKVSAAVNDIAVDEVLMTEDFQLQPRKILEAVTPDSKMIFVCSPNNPTANSVNPLDLINLLENFNGIVVVDEAYIDFSMQASFAELLNKYPNLVILQTLSKAFGLAGIRLGIAIASEEIINLMMKVKAPYNVNKLTSQAAIKAFDYLEAMKAKVRLLLNERERIAAELESMPSVKKVFPSDANFLLFQIDDAQAIYRKLAEKEVIVRYRGNEPHCRDGLRLTIGNPEENNRFLQALREIIN